MDVCDACKSNDDAEEPSLAEKFSKLLDQLEYCNEEEQKQKIEEMNEIIDGMNEEEFESVFKKETFNKIEKMIEKKKVSMENAILLLKHVGYCKMLKNVWNLCFDSSSLGEKFKKMIIEEEKIKEEKNEKLLVDLCECYLLLHKLYSEKLIPICVPCLLKFALKKEESEETRKEKEMALLVLSHINSYYFFRQELYLKEITEIIKNHQEHHNLTQLAYHLKVIVNELHFGREAARELEELTRNMDWKKKEEKMNKEETKEEVILTRWIETSGYYFYRCKLENEENVGLINSIIKVFRAANDNHRGIGLWCTYPLINAVKNRAVKVDALLKGRAIDAVLERMQRPKLDDEITVECLKFFKNVSNRLKEKEKDEKEEEERKATKMEIFEKLEEEGYEDTIASFHKIFDFLHREYSLGTSLKISDYFVNI
eukprot:MONOS_12855.1-p1 / transcript=MONOS_12855.1 / gene=MONOS_12855 / organism=Monocercomonoides_exilis_PA203 / gene_product=unspecified product / transcript_product=unspecified product / location=Mono_scaffold00742:29986-31430(-) / protein_length=427 / sequence_SO=supercontig / SO=protein_coding / is_pseudo=false